MTKKNSAVELTDNLTSLKLPWIRENFGLLSNQAAQMQWTHLDYLRRLFEGETHLRMQRATQRRIKAARFPLSKPGSSSIGPGSKRSIGSRSKTSFASADDIINTLAAAQPNHRLKNELPKYLRPAVLVIDEIGFMPIDKHGADLFFQVISQCYEKGAVILTTTKIFKTKASSPASISPN